jgi:ParB/RepB/Spo0J family partition protein
MIELPADVHAKVLRDALDAGEDKYGFIGEEYGLLPDDIRLMVQRHHQQQRERAAAPKKTESAPVARMPARQSRATLSIDELLANPANVRDDLGELRDLTASIKETGLLQPLVVTEHVDGYLIIDGHRRLEASRKAGLSRLSCVIRHNVTAVPDQVVLMMVANGQRKDLNAVEKAQAYAGLVDSGMSQAEVARRCGVIESQVSDCLTLLDLDDETLDQVRAGKISAYSAIKMIRDVRRSQRAATGRPQRGRTPRKEQRMSVTEKEAAALARLLDTYLGNETPGWPSPEMDLGRERLASVLRKVGRLRQDASDYADLSEPDTADLSASTPEPVGVPTQAVNAAGAY